MNKIALITGASRGIGKQIALTLAKQGFDIALNYRTENDSLNEIVKEIENYKVRCLTIKGDVSIFEDCKNITEQVIEKFERIDVLVNNAGITRDMLFMRMKEDDFKQVVDINLMGTFNMTKNVLKYMIKQRSGRIINISSIVGIHGNAGQANYSASKAGIIGLTKSLAKELAGRNILVNAIAPGFIETDMTSVLNDKVKANILNTIPLKREGKPEEVANVVKFLASEDSSYITGQVISVDGGMN